MGWEKLVIPVCVLIYTKSTITFTEYIPLQRQKRFNQNPLPNIKLPSTAQQQRSFYIFLNNSTIFIIIYLMNIILDLDPSTTWNSCRFYYPTILCTERFFIEGFEFLWCYDIEMGKKGVELEEGWKEDRGDGGVMGFLRRWESLGGLALTMA